MSLAAAGASVGVLGRNPEALAAVVDAAAAAGGQAIAAPADVTDASGLRAAIEVVRTAYGPVDLVVSNAGAREPVPALPWEADADDWWRVVETNLRGPFLVAREVLPAMVERGSGRLLQVGSGMGQRPHPEWSAYAVSKAGLSLLTDSLATALDGTGVVILEASPGLVRTDLTETMWGPAEEQSWNPVQRTLDLVLRFATGDLDALHGRFVHAARDNLDVLLAAAQQIRASDARTLRLRPYGPRDPLT